MPTSHIYTGASRYGDIAVNTRMLCGRWTTGHEAYMFHLEGSHGVSRIYLEHPGTCPTCRAVYKGRPTTSGLGWSRYIPFKVPPCREPRPPLIISDSFRALLKELVKRNNDVVAGMLLFATQAKGGYYRNPEPFGNYITYRERDGLLSFMPHGREQGLTDDGKWSRNGRQDMKPGRLVAKLLHPRLVRKIKPEVLNEFVTRFKCEEQAHVMSCFITEDIEEAYNSRKFTRNQYDDCAIESCMWDDPVADFYEAAGAKAIICKGGNGVYKGRAILWPEVTRLPHHSEVPEKFRLMDRIYCDNPATAAFMKNWCAEQGIAWKSYQNYTEKQSIVYPVVREDGSTDRMSCNLRLRVIPDKPQALLHVDYFPYMDTFTYLDSDGDLYNNPSSCDDMRAELDNTDGSGGDPHEGQVQTHNGEWIDEDDAVMVEGEWYDIRGDDVVMCRRRRDYIFRSDAYEITLRNDSFYIHEDYVNRA